MSIQHNLPTKTKEQDLPKDSNERPTYSSSSFSFLIDKAKGIISVNFSGVANWIIALLIIVFFLGFILFTFKGDFISLFLMIF